MPLPSPSGPLMRQSSSSPTIPFLPRISQTQSLKNADLAGCAIIDLGAAEQRQNSIRAGDTAKVTIIDFLRQRAVVRLVIVAGFMRHKNLQPGRAQPDRAVRDIGALIGGEERASKINLHRHPINCLQECSPPSPGSERYSIQYRQTHCPPARQPYAGTSAGRPRSCRGCARP